jgi:hypothetical protein
MWNRLVYSIDFLQSNYKLIFLNIILGERITYKQNSTNVIPSSNNIIYFRIDVANSLYNHCVSMSHKLTKSRLCSSVMVLSLILSEALTNRFTLRILCGSGLTKKERYSFSFEGDWYFERNICRTGSYNEHWNMKWYIFSVVIFVQHLHIFVIFMS